MVVYQYSLRCVVVNCFFVSKSWMDGRPTILHPFNSISATSRRWECDERLCLRLERFPSRAGLEPGTGRSVGQRLFD